MRLDLTCRDDGGWDVGSGKSARIVWARDGQPVLGDPGESPTLSRFVVQRPVREGCTRIEHPDGDVVVELYLEDGTPADRDILVRVFAGARMLAGQEHPHLAHWEVHDAHAYVRAHGLAPYPQGGMWPDRGPVPKQDRPERVWHEADCGIVGLLRNRRTCYGGRKPLKRYELERLLSVLQTTETDAGERRLYPSGGGIYETEVHVLTAPHFMDGKDTKAREYTFDVDRVFNSGIVSTNGQAIAPECMLVFTGRYGLMAKKYTGMVYAVMLRHIGVLYATLAYHAEALGLGVTPLGGVDAGAVGRVLGRHWAEETPLGAMFVWGAK